MWTYEEKFRDDPLFDDVKLVDHFIHDDEGIWIEYSGPYQEGLHLFDCIMNYAGEQRKFMFMVCVVNSLTGEFTKILSPTSSADSDYTFVENMEEHEKQRLGSKLLSALENSCLFKNLERPFPLPVVFDDEALEFYCLDLKAGESND